LLFTLTFNLQIRIFSNPKYGGRRLQSADCPIQARGATTLRQKGPRSILLSGFH
jgi:hypothetical protein